jgi:hypothetical protein
MGIVLVEGCGDRVVYASVIYCIDGIGHYGLQFYSSRIALRGASRSNDLQFSKSGIATQCAGKGDRPHDEPACSGVWRGL